MYVKDVTLWFNPTTGHDTAEIAGYKLFITDSIVPMVRSTDGTIHSAQVFDLGKPAVDADGKCRVLLNVLPGITSMDGQFNLGIVSVDNAGNESDLFVLNGVELDFQVPEPVTDAGIERA